MGQIFNGNIYIREWDLLGKLKSNHSQQVVLDDLVSINIPLLYGVE